MQSQLRSFQGKSFPHGINKANASVTLPETQVNQANHKRRWIGNIEANMRQILRIIQYCIFKDFTTIENAWDKNRT